MPNVIVIAYQRHPSIVPVLSMVEHIPSNLISKRMELMFNDIGQVIQDLEYIAIIMFVISYMIRLEK
ncbi:hypothetical protein BE843_05985 [Legionella pneumophila subsp. pneumophila]|nr:hypothetical protein BE843_05985 [Legionella pneumophila subsp. pneumophila]AOW61974.1 hypothetical protein BE844_12785 [Legionella pneumophila subsp. pneumophila]AOW67372.1 hypothetical protein BE846_10550 [Legionella pneumophila subsp. pneumophila]